MNIERLLTLDADKIHAEQSAALFQHFSVPEGFELLLPPPSFTEMHGRFLEFQKNKSLTVRFPIEPRFFNPIGVLQGGITTAAFDNVFGPLSYLIAKKPTVTMDLTVNFHRGAKGQWLFVETVLVSRSPRSMSMSGEAINEKGKLIATATTNIIIL